MRPILLVMMLIAPLVARAEWTTRDTFLEAAFVTVTVMDGLQTVQNSHWERPGEPPHKHYEQNPWLGQVPSRQAAILWFGAGIVGHAVVSALLPEGAWRTTWQSGTLLLEAGFVAHNFSIGWSISW